VQRCDRRYSRGALTPRIDSPVPSRPVPFRPVSSRVHSAAKRRVSVVARLFHLSLFLSLSLSFSLSVSFTRRDKRRRETDRIGLSRFDNGSLESANISLIRRNRPRVYSLSSPLYLSLFSHDVLLRYIFLKSQDEESSSSRATLSAPISTYYRANANSRSLTVVFQSDGSR